MGQQYISGEEHQRRQSHTPLQRQNNSKLILVAVAAVIVLLGAGVYGGVVYLNHDQHAQLSSPPAQGIDSTGGSGGVGDGEGISNGSGGSGSANENMRSTGNSAVTGTVTAISATSITVQPSAGGDAQTLALTDNTSFSNTRTQSFGDASSGQGTYTSVHIGDLVLVSPDASHAGQAIGVLLNP